MNTGNIARILVLACAPALAAAESADTDQSVTYRGDRDAMRVCRAVMADNPRRLRQVLRDIRRDSVYGYTLDLTGEHVAGRFTCNGENLLSFSESIGSQETAYFLSTGELLEGRALTASQP